MNVTTPVSSPALDPAKFRDPDVTATGERRASVDLESLETLWFNTGSLCNLTCSNCYIESSPKNDRLVYISAAEVRTYLTEIAALQLPTREIAFTGGEPFMNPEIMDILEAVLEGGFRCLVLTNAMRPMMKCTDRIADLQQRFGDRLTVRVSLDHYTETLHDMLRGERSWEKTLLGLRWLAETGVSINVAGRTCWGESEDSMRQGFGRLFEAQAISIDPQNPEQLVLFPEMDETQDVPEITESCWDILNVAPSAMMCATSRMVVKRKGASAPVVVPCTLLPYDPSFDFGTTLESAAEPVKLNHPHCAKFCVLGGGSCSVTAD
ncbi:MAG: radical SAM protein [Rhodospirillaceae bacterium]|nr:radical SAM protein [Rhodospirillaceae bacterium]MDD9915498.1 radical SAM protein [Rhodospirillaceae bacterium]MDD9929853.1 radical SAM protein [Rhodospirillaceae bacterium]